LKKLVSKFPNEHLHGKLDNCIGKMETSENKKQSKRTYPSRGWGQNFPTKKIYIYFSLMCKNNVFLSFLPSISNMTHLYNKGTSMIGTRYKSSIIITVYTRL
jgi:hypothetical protein